MIVGIRNWRRQLGTKCTYVILHVCLHPSAYKIIRLSFIISVITNVGFRDKFLIQSRSTSQGLPYDYSSIMHYRHNTFSRTRFGSTMIPGNRTIPKATLGNTVKPTELDFLHLNLLYCEGKESKFVH